MRDERITLTSTQLNELLAKARRRGRVDAARRDFIWNGMYPRDRSRRITGNGYGRH